MQQVPIPDGARLRAIVTLLLLASLTLLMGLAEPGSYRWIPGCPLHDITGLYCTGCGSLRALRCLVTGDLAGSLSSNALLAPSLLLILTGLLQDLLTPGRGPLSAGSRSSRTAGTGFLIAAALFTILRNLPLGFAELLRPV